MTMASASPADRLLIRALSISVAAHALLIGVLLIAPKRDAPLERDRPHEQPLKLIYQSAPAAASRAQWRSEPVSSESRYGRLPEPALGPSAAAMAGRMGGLGGGMAGELSRAAVERGDVWSPAALPSGPVQAQAIDLTNLTAAAQGNPVRFAYFSAIRERVQRTADTQNWEAAGAQRGGVVYVEFVVERTGRVHSAASLQGRSRASAPLCETAVRLVTTSTPFPPFPPSFEESSLTLLLPIEFMSADH